MSDHHHINGGPSVAADASEGDEDIERIVASLNLCSGISDEMKVAVAFAIRCAYGIGYEEGRGSVRRAA